ncbi:O-Antigen ligase [Roseimaritima multifibrata]|uniref:O-Antigen ligase n=1 Tax=Roseimaritima multifibrata TaxID=1930274 RepID=A0A517MNL8_9BACT|nr:O-antigen ligase family protein [Roseimaritima multifibrata]QDS96377.1 O-Antigen ligase [Roseimaritima multifibrata]
MNTTAPSKKHPTALALLLTLLLAGTTIWTAWDNGGGHRSTQATAAGLLLLLFPLGLALVAANWKAAPRFRVSPLVALACLAWFLGFCQTIPLPNSLLGILSPGSLAAYQDFVPAGLLAEAEAQGIEPAGGGSRHPISVAPLHTRIALTIPAGFAVACWLSTLCCREKRWGVILLLSIAGAGTLFAFFGLADSIRLARDSSEELRQRLLISPVGVGDPFGPFINNNNCAGYLNLAIAAAIGLLPLSIRRPPGSETTSETPPAPKATNPIPAASQWRTIGICLMIAILVGGILGSQSRGGALGMLAGASVLGLYLFRSGAKFRTLVVAAGTIAAAILLLSWLGMTTDVRNRLETLTSGESMNDPRLEHWQDGLRTAVAHLPGGAGLGTYRFAHLPFQAFETNLWFYNADGMHVEWLVEGGFWWIPIILAGLYFLIRDTRTLASDQDTTSPDQRSYRQGLVLASLFLIPSMIISQSFDFAIALPPVLLTVACLAGAISGAASETTQSLADRRETSGKGEWFLRLLPDGLRRSAKKMSAIGGEPSGSTRNRQATIASLLVLAILIFAQASAYVFMDRGAEAERANFAHNKHAATPADRLPDYTARFQGLENQIAGGTLIADGDLGMARWIVNEQRRAGAKWLVEQKLADSKQADRIVSPRTLRRALQQAAVDETGQTLQMEDLLTPTQSLQRYRDARDHALAAMLQSPLDDRPKEMLIELDFLDPNAEENSPQLLEQIKKLRHTNPAIMRRIQRLKMPNKENRPPTSAEGR